MLSAHKGTGMLAMAAARANEPIRYPTLPAASARALAGLFRETDHPEPPRPRLLDRVRQALRARHYSRRTEAAHVAWIRRYIFFHDKRHPAETGAPEVTKFLTSPAVDGNVAASAQNQALSALLFLSKDVLQLDLPGGWSRPTSGATWRPSGPSTGATSPSGPAA